MNKKEIKVKDIEVGKLRSLLRHGDMKKIAKKTGFAPNYVRMVLNPNINRSNPEIIKETIKFVESEGYIIINSELADSLTG